MDSARSLVYISVFHLYKYTYMILILYNVIIIKGDNRRKIYSKNFTEYLFYILLPHRKTNTSIRTQKLSYTFTCKTSCRSFLSFLHLLFLFQSFINKAISNKLSGDANDAGPRNILGESRLSSVMSITHLSKKYYPNFCTEGIHPEDSLALSLWFLCGVLILFLWLSLVNIHPAS